MNSNNTPIPTQIMAPAPGSSTKLDSNTVCTIIQQMNYCYDQNKNVYCEVEIQNKKKWRQIESTDFIAYVQTFFQKTYHKVLKQTDIKNLIPILHLHALENCKQAEVYNRIARLGDEIFIETQNTSDDIIKITPAEWSVTQTSPLIFKRFTHQASIPNPATGGSLDELFSIFSINNIDEQILIGTWLVSSLFTNLPRPHLWFVGEKGSGKTTLALSLKKLIDPVSRGNFMYRNTSEMAQVIDHHAIPFFDNFTKINVEISDLLCATFTGTDFTKRKQYTNDDDFTFSIKKPIILASISLGNPASDLLDRCIVIEKSKNARKTIPEEMLMKAFEDKKPRIIGGILDAAVETLRTYRDNEVSEYIRLADFQRIGIAAAQALGFTRVQFETALTNNLKNKGILKLQSFPVASLVIKFMENNEYWEGTMFELQNELRDIAEDPDLVNSNPSILSRNLKDCKNILEQANLEVIPGSNGSNGRKYTIRRITSNDSADYIDYILED
ncbi:MAG: hypothetical protein EOL98_09465 [Negativicutes bacterium]|nr:hypothetical protein [Negativicutes bacterium]